MVVTMVSQEEEEKEGTKHRARQEVISVAESG
jgi:hypothetical protein